MEEPPTLDERLLLRIGELNNQGDHIKALEMIEDILLSHGKQKVPLLTFKEGLIFGEQADKTNNAELKFTYMLGSVECFADDDEHSWSCASTLFDLGIEFKSMFYRKKALKEAKRTLSLVKDFSEKQKIQDLMEIIARHCEEGIAADKTLLGFPVENAEQEVRESNKNESKRKSDSDNFVTTKLKSYWDGMNLESKRNFMKISTAKLKTYVDEIHGSEGKKALEDVLKSAMEDRKWKFWMCRTCKKKFLHPKKCKSHLEQEHKAKFKPSTTRVMAEQVDEVWAGMLAAGSWEAVDVLAAVKMIEDQPAAVKEFVYEKGWSKEWPLAADEERRKALKEISLLLVSLWDHKILSCSIQDWIMNFAVEHLGKLGVSEDNLLECHLFNTPQCICCLECHELYQILDLLNQIKCKRNDSIDMVSKAVDRLCSPTQVKEKIDFDHQFSSLLLDKRLLRCQIASFDNEGTIDVIDPNVHYAKAHVQGDDIISWLIDYPLIDERFQFPRPIRAYNLDIWLAVLKVVQFMCRSLGTKYGKKLWLLGYDAALTEAKNLCIREDERRENLQEDQWNTYAYILGEKGDEQFIRDNRYCLNSQIFLCAARDILVEALHPKSDVPSLDDCLKLIGETKSLSDDRVLKSIDFLKLVVTNKILIIDSKMLLIENLRINLLNDLTRLSVFDYRSYILQLLKYFLKGELAVSNAEAKSAAAEAELLLMEEQNKEKEKPPVSKKKKKKSNKKQKTSTNLSSPIDDQNVNIEPQVTIPSREKDLMELEDGTLESETDQLKISSSPDHQEEATTDMQNMPGEASTSAQVESPPIEVVFRDDSALDMTLKALLNIKVLKEDMMVNQEPVHDNQKEQYEELYSNLLNSLRASLEEVQSMSSDATEVLITILDFWGCWTKSPKESLVTRLFTLEEEERTSCSKCRRNSNYPQRSSNGLVVGADSIRYLMSTFRNMKFEDILKVNSMEEKILCDIKTGGCGKQNFVHHIITRCPPIFTITLEWEKNETEHEISKTTKALVPEINISKLYEGLETNAKYQLASMVCWSEEEYVCIGNEKDNWVRHNSVAEEIVGGSWESVVCFCREKSLRPEILFFEAV